MKKFLVVVLLTLFLAGCSHAQTKFATKGVWELGGDIGFSSSTPVTNGSTGTSESCFSFGPCGGYFPWCDFEIGLRPEFESRSSGGSTSSRLNLFVDPSYYFPIPNKNIYPFVHALAGYSSESFSDSPTLSGFSWGVGAGVKVEVGESSLIDLRLNYTQYTLNPSGADKRYGRNDIKIEVGFSTFLK